MGLIQTRFFSQNGAIGCIQKGSVIGRIGFLQSGLLRQQYLQFHRTPLFHQQNQAVGAASGCLRCILQGKHSFIVNLGKIRVTHLIEQRIIRLGFRIHHIDPGNGSGHIGRLCAVSRC